MFNELHTVVKYKIGHRHLHTIVGSLTRIIKVDDRTLFAFSIRFIPLHTSMYTINIIPY